MDESESAGGGVLGSHWKEDWVLATIDSWVCSGRPKEDVVGKIMTSFGLKELREAARSFQKGDWVSPNISILGEGSPDYSRKLAERTYDAMVLLQNLEVAPVSFFVSASNLCKVPGAAFVDNLDEPAVSARLAGVDAQMTLMMEKLKATEQLGAHVVELARTVTGLKDELKEAKKVHQQNTGTLKDAAAAFEKSAAMLEKAVPKAAPVQSYAERVAGAGARRQSRVRTLQSTARTRSGRSVSSKRGMESDEDSEQNPSQRARMEVEKELSYAKAARASHPAPLNSALSQSLSNFASQAQGGFVEVKRRRRGATSKGSSTVEADGGEKPPFSVFLSGTSISTDETTVKDKLRACYAALGSDDESEVPRAELKVLKIEQIKLKIPEGETPRSKCWKVTVAPEFALHMTRGEAYPQAWGWRKWHSGPRTPQGNTSAADGRA